MHEVIISEKPKSAEKIAKALSSKAQKKKYKKISYWEFEEAGKKTTVLSGVGHLYSLTSAHSKNRLGFDLIWVPSYEIDKSSSYTRDYLNAIKKFGKGADSYIHACDYDIEGTLIGYNILKYACGNNAESKATRMKFSTLTKKDILDAYNHPLKLDYNQVDSGIARHMLDYYFGMNISSSLSAGRVQTPTLSILADREKQIKEFVPEPYWLIKALSDHGIEASHVEGRIFEKERADKIFNECQGADATVTEVKVSETIRKPPVPFNLGGLQAEAHKPHEGKKEDAAHPAIHPTGVLPGKLSPDEDKIYRLIVYRFISVFAENSKLETMKSTLNVAGEEFAFSRKRVSYEGWLKHYPFKKQEDDKFPPIKEGDLLKIHEILMDEKETKPPARYNEASLIKELEKKELGTKATRADIISKLYDRKYIEGRQIEVKPLGMNMVETLKEYCKDLTSEELTRTFERELEGISSNELTKEKILEDGEKEVRSILKDIHNNEEKIGSMLYGAYQETNVVGECACGGKLIKRHSPRYKTSFIGCSNFPKCRVTYSLPKGANILKKKCPVCGLPMISYGKPRKHVCMDPNCGKEVSRRQAPEVVGKCPECGRDLLKRSGRYGDFIGCSNFPRCRFTCSLDELNEIGKKKKENEANTAGK